VRGVFSFSMPSLADVPSSSVVCILSHTSPEFADLMGLVLAPLPTFSKNSASIATPRTVFGLLGSGLGVEGEDFGHSFLIDAGFRIVLEVIDSFVQPAQSNQNH
jgi:hypothetical protein